VQKNLIFDTAFYLTIILIFDAAFYLTIILIFDAAFYVTIIDGTVLVFYLVTVYKCSILDTYVGEIRVCVVCICIPNCWIFLNKLFEVQFLTCSTLITIEFILCCIKVVSNIQKAGSSHIT